MIPGILTLLSPFVWPWGNDNRLVGWTGQLERVVEFKVRERIIMSGQSVAKNSI